MSSGSPSRFIHHGAFGNDRFGVTAERFARFFGTPRFIIGQTVRVVVWITLDAAAFSFRWDPYPFILLNSPLDPGGLCRTADPARSDPPSRARQAPRCRYPRTPRCYTKLTEEIARLTAELHAAICTYQTGEGPDQINLTPR
jgi:hypothetical protein